MNVSARARSFRYAFRGVRTLIVTQPNARIHLIATLCVVVVGLALGLDLIEWCVLTLTCLSVWTAEAFNTVIEWLCDLVSPAEHPLVGRIKDVAAGAVLLCALGSVAVAALVFGSRLV